MAANYSINFFELTAISVLLGTVPCGLSLAQEIDHSASVHHSATDENVSRPQPAGTLLMIKELQKAIGKQDILKEPFRNSEKAAYYFEKIKNAPAEQKEKYRIPYILQLFFAGETDTAIAELERYMAANRIDSKKVDEDSKRIIDLLGIAYLRLGEQRNCLANHHAESCIVPFQQPAFHRDKTGAEEALKIYSNILTSYPDDLGSRWLLNVAYMALGLYPDSVPETWLVPLRDSYSGRDFPRFNNIAGKLGVDVNLRAGGCVADDFNNDGFIDIVTSAQGVFDQLKYFENDGQGGFLDKTESSGLTGITGGLNIIQADYDNDGFTDILVLRGAWLGQQGKFPNSLLRNLGNGRFEDVAIQAGLLSYYPTQTACWGDFNNDGQLDLFIGNESGKSPVTDNETLEDNPLFPSELYLNNGDGTFTNIASQLHLEINEFVKGATWIDYNNDELLDLFVSIQGKENKLFKNEGGTSISGWKFTDVSMEAGILSPIYSFATGAFDFNNDGWQDLFVASFDSRNENNNAAAEFAAEMLGLPARAEKLVVYKNNGDGTFTDYSRQLRLDKSLFAMGFNYGDLDNDGFPDLYLATGTPFFTAIVPDRVFRNVNGNYFEEVTFSGGFGHLQKGHGVAFADFDNDGDQDIYHVLGGAFEGDNFPNALFENPGNDNSWISIKLEGKLSNQNGISAQLKFDVVNEKGVERSIFKVAGSGGSFGANPLEQQIGLGDAVMIKALSVKWQGKEATIDIFENISVNQFIRIEEKNPEIKVELKKKIVLGTGPNIKNTPSCH